MLRLTGYRRALPAAHIVLDLLLAMVAMYPWMQWKHEAAQLPLPQVTPPAAYAQESEAISWDPAIQQTPGPAFLPLLSGTLPAGFVATMLRRNRDALWLTIHEAIAIPLWFLIGSLADAGRRRLRLWMRRYLIARYLFAVLGVALGGERLWFRPQSLFWLTLCSYGLVCGPGLWSRALLTSRPAS